MQRTLALALLLALVPGLAAAGDRWPVERGSIQLVRQGGGQQRISAAQAAEIARQQTGGRVLGVQEAGSGYRVKVLTPSGEVRYVFVDGSGR